MAESIPFNDQRFNANILNKSTVAPKISSDGTSITVSTNDNSVWYRTPAWEARTGVVYGLETEVTKEGFEISVDIDDADLKQQIAVSSDQGGIMLHVGDALWVKAGLEMDDGVAWAGCVVTNPYSDWSKQLASPTLSKRFTISLRGTDLKVFIGTDMIRHSTCFGFESQQLEIGKKVRVGVMACSPSGGGAKATFRNFAFRALKD